MTSIADILRELPADAVVARFLDKTVYTAAEMIREIESGTSVGSSFATDMMRVARDFLRRQAGQDDAPTMNKRKPKPGCSRKDCDIIGPHVHQDEKPVPTEIREIKTRQVPVRADMTQKIAMKEKT